MFGCSVYLNSLETLQRFNQSSVRCKEASGGFLLTETVIPRPWITSANHYMRVIADDLTISFTDLVQETAARGLTMVYELGDKATKDDLVKSLVSSFTGEKRTLTGNVSADTELFEPGALPTGDGSISTYKDVCCHQLFILSTSPERLDLICILLDHVPCCRSR